MIKFKIDKGMSYLVRSLAGVAAVLAAAWFVIANSALAAGGTGPGDALAPTGGYQTLAPGQDLWFRFDYGGDRSQITITLDSGDANQLSFALYLPDAIRAWQNGDTLKAIGTGAPDPNHALVWQGQFRINGTYYVVVHNASDTARSFQLNVQGDAVTTVYVPPAPTATPLPNPFAKTTSVGSVKGGKIAFQEASGGNIYVVNADGTNLQRVTFGLDPAFSPDGTKLAFARQGPVPGLFMANADGSNEQLVYGANEVRSPTWSPDGTRIAFSTLAGDKPSKEVCFRGRCFDREGTSVWKLKQYDLNTGKTVDIFTPPTGGQSPTYSADNNTIAFVGGEMGLMVTSSDNHFTPYVIAGDLRITSESYDPLHITAPVYSPDGTKLTFMVPQPPSWQIAVANADGSGVRGLTHLDVLDFVHPNNVAPTWAPDSSQILFLSNRNNGKWEFFAINADGTNERQVLKNVTDQLTLNYQYSAERVASWVK